MRLIVITLVSVLGYSFADVLQVKCVDKLCERPSNKAVTTLKYVPDKPYKLQIFSINSEVEIFGATNDLYYGRYGKSFGFMPKTNLREMARGHFEHLVEINFDNIKVNPELKERNFLHEILKSSQSSTNVNETGNSNDVKENDKQNIASQQEEEKNKAESSNSNSEERPTEYIPIGTEPEIPIKKEEEPKKLENVVDEVKSVENEKKLEEDKAADEKKTQEATEEDDEEEDDEEEDDEEDEDSEVLDSAEENNSTQIPESITAPPIAVELKKEEEKIDLNATDNTAGEKVEQEKVQEEKKEPEEIVKPEIVEEKKDEIKEEQQVIVEEEQKAIENKTEIVEPTKEAEKIEEKIEEKPKEDIPEFKELPTEKPKDPAPVTEEIIEEIPIPITTTEEPIQNKFEPEIPPPNLETTTKSFETVTESPSFSSDEKHESSTKEVPPLPQEKRENNMNQDLLLKRFEEKLGHKNTEGIGSVEQINKDHHGHSHSHSHGQHHHSHSHMHSHESVTTNSPHQHEHHHSIDENKNNEIPKEEEVVQNEDKKPGFFGGLVKKIFGDEHEIHQHDVNEKVDMKLAEEMVDEGFCEKIDSENCPKSLKTDTIKHEPYFESPKDSTSLDEYFKIILKEAVEKMDIIITMGLVALTVLIFIFGHYCISKASKEGELIRKMNTLERELMASTKENGALKTEVEITKQQLKSIQDNSFGSNDMVIALKNELESSEKEKEELLDKISSLEKELEAAAEDGLELNRMVSELLSNQTGSDSIISSVEDLQRQLNEQQETIVTMNEALAAKSRENTELQIQLSEINSKFDGDLEKFQQEVNAIMLERSNLQVELENLKRESDVQVNQIVEERNSEVTRLNNELTSYAGKYDESKKLLIAAESKVQALEECIDTIKKNKGVDVKNLLDVADLKADLLAVTKEKSTIQEQLQNERDSKKLLEDRVKTVSDEMSNLKKEFSMAEKEKLDAQTRLDVLSNYFKEKETQLQQELSVKEARWMKQQGETTSTVEKVQALNAEIQTLKSQNDELKAELEAQVISYKAKLSSVEAQSHAAWLAAKQADRKMEEARMEAATLRRRLTSIAENPTGASTELLNGLPGAPNESMNSIPSPMRVESPNNISLPPPPMMMPPFLPGAPFLPPPPFMPGDLPPPPMGLPPLGRLMSPPPKRFTPTMRDDRDRYSPRGRYSPDSRYDDYTPFETETDISPPRSPVPQRRGYSSPSDRNKKSKGGHNSEQPSRRK